MLTAEQVIAANKANIETLFGLTNKAFEGVEKLVELNLQVTRAALGEVADTTKAALSVKDAQELFALQAGLLQPAAEKAAAYSRHLYDIAAATNAEVGKVAEETAVDAQKKFMSWSTPLSRTLPPAPKTPSRWSSRLSLPRTTRTKAFTRLPSKLPKSPKPTSRP